MKKEELDAVIKAATLILTFDSILEIQRPQLDMAALHRLIGRPRPQPAPVALPVCLSKHQDGSSDLRYSIRDFDGVTIVTAITYDLALYLTNLINDSAQIEEEAEAISCPVDDPSCEGADDQSHDACERPSPVCVSTEYGDLVEREAHDFVPNGDIRSCINCGADEEPEASA